METKTIHTGTPLAAPGTPFRRGMCVEIPGRGVAIVRHWTTKTVTVRHPLPLEISVRKIIGKLRCRWFQFSRAHGLFRPVKLRGSTLSQEQRDRLKAERTERIKKLWRDHLQGLRQE